MCIRDRSLTLVKYWSTKNCSGESSLEKDLDSLVTESLFTTNSNSNKEEPVLTCVSIYVCISYTNTQYDKIENVITHCRTLMLAQIFML